MTRFGRTISARGEGCDKNLEANVLNNNLGIVTDCYKRGSARGRLRQLQAAANERFSESIARGKGKGTLK